MGSFYYRDNSTIGMVYHTSLANIIGKTKGLDDQKYFIPYALSRINPSQRKNT